MMNVTERIRSAAENAGQPFDRMLFCFAVERMLRALWEIDEQGLLVLRDDRLISLSEDKRRIDPVMRFYDSGIEPMSAAEFAEFLDNLKAQAKMLELSLECDVEERGETKRRLSFRIAVDTMYVPLVWEISPAPEDLFPQKTERASAFDEGDTFFYFRQGSEELAASHLFPILEKLELLNEPEHYLSLYLLLGSETVDGRRFLALFDKMCRESGVSIDPKRLSLWKSYREYPYMKKRWKVLLRKEKRTAPSWEECMDRLTAFAEPPLTGLIRGEHFFGDWMPELLRYLD